MKKLFFIALLTLSNLLVAQPDESANGVLDTNLVITPEAYHSKVEQVVTTILTKYHYKKTRLNDSLSAVVFDKYIETLDNNKMYFYKSDIDEFTKDKYLIDDFLLTGNVDFAFKVFNTFKQRLNDRMKYIAHRLEKEFDYSVDESFTPDRDGLEWAANETELADLWRKRIKNDALNKKLAGDDWEKISKDLMKRYQNFQRIILQYKAEDVFQLYMNAFAAAVDPHTNYLSPITSENFDISMSRALEGIGAQLRSIDGYTTVASIIAGGPADKSKQLFEDDRIVAVGQGEDGEMVDVVGWRLDDVVQMIRGKKGTIVRLEILRADDTPDMPTEKITLVRDKVKLEDQSAKADTIFLNQNGSSYKLGVVRVPAFYIDFKARARGDQDYKSTTRDVKKLITDLQGAQVDGIIIDLRNNGGGSLQEAIEMTGLFIKDGPVVQVKDSRGDIQVDDDPDPSIFYDGPLAVMVNRYSASASEIFSAAIQDYGRGLVIGEQSFGKGTVQNLFDLNRMIRFGDTKLGDVKLTIAKFYRINGSSTQKKGVMPDITYPGYDRDEFGEASYPSALKWDQIASSDYHKYDSLEKYLPELIKNHKKRIKGNLDFQFLQQDIEEYESNKNKKSFSLNEAVRKAEREKAEARKKEREEERKKNAELKVVDKDEVSGQETKIDDYLLEESGRILADLIELKFG